MAACRNGKGNGEKQPNEASYYSYMVWTTTLSHPCCFISLSFDRAGLHVRHIRTRHYSMAWNTRMDALHIVGRTYTLLA